MSDKLKPCPFHNTNTCGCYDWVDVSDKVWNARPLEDALLTRADAAERELARLQERTRWHKYPVEEPPTTGEYRVNYKGDIFITKYTTGGFGWHTAIPVTHWQYLPEPPEDDNE